MNETFGWLQGIAEWIMQKIDKLFSYFDVYSGKWGKWILLIIGIAVASKVFKIKLNLGK